MKKETILEALKDFGELDEEKVSNFIKVIQKENGIDIENAKKVGADKEQALADKEKEIETLKSEYEGKLAEKNAELGKFNVSEIEELRKFKNDTLFAQKEEAHTKAIDLLIGDEKYGFDKKAVKLLRDANKGKFTFNENDEITNIDEVMTGLQTDYADYIVKQKETGSEPANITSTETNIVDPFVAGFNSKK